MTNETTAKSKKTGRTLAELENESPVLIIETDEEVLEGQAETAQVFEAKEALRRTIEKAVNPFNTIERRFLIGLSQLVEMACLEIENAETGETRLTANFQETYGQHNAEHRAQVYGFLFDEHLTKDKATQTKFQADFFGIYGFLSLHEADALLEYAYQTFAEIMDTENANYLETRDSLIELIDPIKTQGLVLYKTSFDNDGEIISDFDRTALSPFALTEAQSEQMEAIGRKLTATEIGVVQNVSNLLQESMFRQLGKTVITTDKNGKEKEKFIHFPVKARRFMELLQLHFKAIEKATDSNEPITEPLIISTSQLESIAKESKSTIEDGRRTLVAWQKENGLVLVEIASTDTNATSYKLNYRNIVLETAQRIFEAPDEATLKFLYGETLSPERLLTAKRTLRLESGVILESLPKDENDNGGQTLSESQLRQKAKFEDARKAKAEAEAEAKANKVLADAANATEITNALDGTFEADAIGNEVQSKETKTPNSAMFAISTQLSLWKVSFEGALKKAEFTPELANILLGIANEANSIAEICEDTIETIGI